MSVEDEPHRYSPTFSLEQDSYGTVDAKERRETGLNGGGGGGGDDDDDDDDDGGGAYDEQDFGTTPSSATDEARLHGGWHDVMHLADAAVHLSNRGDVTFIPDEKPGAWVNLRTLWAYTGPGFLMCIAYLDPGNIEADLQTGAYTGYQLMWVLLSSHVVGFIIQSLAARLGVVSGNHLATICRDNYPPRAYLMLWFGTELAIIGSDIQEVLGSAIALQILLGIPLWAGCLVTAVDTFTFLFMHVFGVRKLEALFVVLVATMTVAFFMNWAEDPPPPKEVLEGFVPVMSSYATIPALALIGAVIMPHNIYLHSALVLSRAIDRSDPIKVREACKYTSIDSALALLVAFFINMAVVGTFAVHFFDSECAHASTISACLIGDAIDPTASIYGDCTNNDGLAGQCQEIGLSHAGDALRGALGSSAKYVWAIGLLAAGQSSTMTGTYAGQFVMEGFLRLEVPQWQRLLITRCVALVPALVVTISLNNNNTATDRLSEWINVLQSVQLPFALIPLLHFCGSTKVMGDHTANSRMLGFSWCASVFVICVNVYIVSDYLTRDGSLQTWAFVLLVVVSVLYVSFCLSLMKDDAMYLWDVCVGMIRRWNFGGRPLEGPLNDDSVDGRGGRADAADDDDEHFDDSECGSRGGRRGGGDGSVSSSSNGSDVREGGRRGRKTQRKGENGGYANGDSGVRWADRHDGVRALAATSSREALTGKGALASGGSYHDHKEGGDDGDDDGDDDDADEVIEVDIELSNTRVVTGTDDCAGMVVS